MTPKIIREYHRLRHQLASHGLGNHARALQDWVPYELNRNLRYILGGAPGDLPPLSVRFTASLPYGEDLVAVREGRGLTILLPMHNVARAAELAIFHGPAYLYWLTACARDIEVFSITLSDGEAGTAARFAPSSNRPDVIALPDPYFFQWKGFADWRRRSENDDVPWESRSARITWVGASSGKGTYDPVLAQVRPERGAARLLLCLALRDITDCEGGIVFMPPGEVTLDVLRRHGLASPRVPEETWLGRKFAIDIDGQTNTWSNLLVRFHYGCCVLKVESQHGYRQWYYDRIKPWEHFIPVRADLSDLAEKIEWVRSHDARSHEIARNGRAFARTLTYEAGLADAVRLITENWRPYEGFVAPGQGFDHGAYGS
ncbi:glycosyl transferase family 90 [Terrihabitans rhizophilus]|uniref:Glycosyl transferase family 90 n=1 Tax=Terrihabitans rhizophilus TaxID=3092662 RepID=A0ABU4RTQ2_9HYPH|nr:glycosyl transferase family 90 [Terrihabitans sp. PJ23]MDX6807055.1 glycosyl transferase family 90 [Terrihabitans sp. PJ23]